MKTCSFQDWTMMEFTGSVEILLKSRSSGVRWIKVNKIYSQVSNSETQTTGDANVSELRLKYILQKHCLVSDNDKKINA